MNPNWPSCSRCGDPVSVTAPAAVVLSPWVNAADRQASDPAISVRLDASYLTDGAEMLCGCSDQRPQISAEEESTVLGWLHAVEQGHDPKVRF